MDKYDIFISYKNVSEPTARAFYHILSQNYDVFFDKESLLPGERWHEVIPRALRVSSVSIVIISSLRNKSVYSENEIIIANELQKEGSHVVIPVVERHGIELPYTLLSYHALYIKDGKVSSVLPELNKVLQRVLQKPHKIELENAGYRHNRIAKAHATYGELSGLLNTKDDFFIYLQNMIRQQSENKFDYPCLIYIDVDKFSLINIKYGEKIGDAVMQTIDSTLQETCSRYFFQKIGKDEFIVCTDDQGAELLQLMANIKSAIENINWEHISDSIYVTVSSGWARLVIPGEQQDFAKITNDWITRAVLGCRYAKRDGGNTYKEGPGFIEKHYKGDFKDLQS